MDTRFFVLYAVSKALAEDETISRSLLETIADSPDDHFSIAWTVLRLQRGICLNEDKFKRLSEQLNNSYFGSGPGFPLWVHDGSILLDLPLSELDSEFSIVDRNFHSEFSWLDDQSQVELFLALIGCKVSRLTLHVSDIIKLQSKLRVPLVCGTEIVESVYDEPLSCFSNLAKKISINFNTDFYSKLLSNNSQLEVYIAKNWRAAALCWALDRRDKAGALLGIPECCSRWFMKNWKRCVNDYSGDMAFLCVAPEFDVNKIEISASGNPYSMYLGGGLISHFPCQTGCVETNQIFNFRASVIKEIAPELFIRVYGRHFDKFWVSSRREVSKTQPVSNLDRWLLIEPK